jgi:hypothetical protein
MSCKRWLSCSLILAFGLTLSGCCVDQFGYDDVCVLTNPVYIIALLGTFVPINGDSGTSAPPASPPPDTSSILPPQGGQ